MSHGHQAAAGRRRSHPPSTSMGAPRTDLNGPAGALPPAVTSGLGSCLESGSSEIVLAGGLLVDVSVSANSLVIVVPLGPENESAVRHCIRETPDGVEEQISSKNIRHLLGSHLSESSRWRRRGDLDLDRLLTSLEPSSPVVT
jgi:hypothetical protein